MPLEQTDMNVGFNSGADKVNFSTRKNPRARTDSISLILPRISGSQARKIKSHTFLVIPGNSLDRLSRNQ